MQLRDYQRSAVDAVWEHLRTDDGTLGNPCVVLPTGGGKTPVIATLCKEAVEWGGKVVVLAHVKELLTQAREKLLAVCPELPVGIFSAGLGKKETKYPITLAGIQSIYKRAFDFERINLIICDEAHRIPPADEGMWRKFIDDARCAFDPKPYVIGLTATPFRTSSGKICGRTTILNRVCYEVGIKELIERGFLTKLVSKPADCDADTSSLHIRGGEFIEHEIQGLMNSTYKVSLACREIVHHARDRKSVLIFTSGADHCLAVVNELKNVHRCEVESVTGDTSPLERVATLERFKSGSLKYLANINVLTEGFDATRIDCVALLRPTASPGLFYQMCGRGFRIHQAAIKLLVVL